jgi:hypothetical protein
VSEGGGPLSRPGVGGFVAVALITSGPTQPITPPQTNQVAEEVFSIAGRDPLIEVAIKLQVRTGCGGREGVGGEGVRGWGERLVWDGREAV